MMRLATTTEAAPRLRLALQCRPWPETFRDILLRRSIFERFKEDHLLEPSFATACAVGVSWHQFSEFMPWFLCRACAKVKNNEKRHYVIQTAYEELGMKRADKIHPDMFWTAVSAAGVTEFHKNKIRESSEIQETLAFLKRKLLSYKSDASVFGILLGLEFPAEENIETIFRALAHTQEIREFLDQHEFFVLHREIEKAHVDLTLSNFYRFCSKPADQKKFLGGFEDGIEFWNRFWGRVSEAIRMEERRPKRA